MVKSLLVILVLNAFLTVANAQVRSEKVRVVYSAIGGSHAAQVDLAGDAPIAMFNGGSVISANLAGADLVDMATGMNVLPFLLVVGPGVKQIEDLKGDKIAITRFGSATDFALRFAAEKWLIKPEKNFTVLQLGGQPEMMAALKSGAVQGAMLNAEFTVLARRERNFVSRALAP